jgi:thiamine pyrophosphate-dependent acetolactate synthase large subunit-like protein
MKRSHLEVYPRGAAAAWGIFYGVNIPGSNYATLVEPFGGYGVHAEDPGQPKPVLQSALAAVNSGKSALVDVVLAS